MKSILETYDQHLKQLAAVPPDQRFGVTQRVMFPWLLATIAVFLLVRAFALSPGLGVWIVVPAAGFTLAGAIYAVWRVTHHGWKYSRTPTDPLLRDKPGADLLIRALQRVTLNGLSDLALETRLRTDLKLTQADMTELLAILSAESRLRIQDLSEIKAGDMTVGMLLEKM